MSTLKSLTDVVSSLIPTVQFLYDNIVPYYKANSVNNRKEITVGIVENKICDFLNEVNPNVPYMNISRSLGYDDSPWIKVSSPPIGPSIKYAIQGFQMHYYPVFDYYRIRYRWIKSAYFARETTHNMVKKLDDLDYVLNNIKMSTTKAAMIKRILRSFDRIEDSANRWVMLHPDKELYPLADVIIQDVIQDKVMEVRTKNIRAGRAEYTCKLTVPKMHQETPDCDVYKMQADRCRDMIICSDSFLNYHFGITLDKL